MFSDWHSWYRYILLAGGVFFVAEGVDVDSPWWATVVLFIIGFGLLSRFERTPA